MTEKDKNHVTPPPPPAARPAPASAPVPTPATGGLPPEAYMTEQEKDALKTGSPSSKAPYATGDPPPVHETVSRSQGIKGATDPKETPSESSGPAGTVKKETR